MAGLTAPRPITAERDRETFDCGRGSINQWFRRHAWRNQQSGASRTNVACDVNTGAVVGCVALCAARIERALLPKPAQRNQPDKLAAVLLGQLAVDRRHQGLGGAGLAESLDGGALKGRPGPIRARSYITKSMS
jgi:hypothetical protein